MNQSVLNARFEVTEITEELKRAVEMINVGSIDSAWDTLERVQKLDPSNPQVLNLVGNLCVIKGCLEVAKSKYIEALEQDKYSIDTILNLANVENLLGNTNIAKTYTDAALRINPKSIEAQFRLSFCQISDGELSAAEQTLNRILEESPSFIPAILQRALLHIEAQNTLAALDDLNRCIEIDPSNAQAYFNRGNIFLEHNQTEAAMVDYSDAISNGLNTDILNFNYGKALITQGRIFDAKEAFKNAIKCNPDAFDPFFALGTIALSEKNYKHAILQFTSALKLNPHHIDSLNNRAIAFKGSNDYRRALSDYKKILKIFPKDTRALQNAALTCLEIKDYKNAEKFARKIIRIDDKSLDAYLIKGHILYETGRYEEAIKNYSIAQKNHPKSPEPDLQIGNVHRLNRRYDEAIQSYEKALEKGSEKPFLKSDLIFTKLQTCAWDGIESELDKLKSDISAKRAAISPFVFLTFCDDPREQRAVSEAYAEDTFESKSDIDPIEKYKGHDKIRLAYYSADFNDHATMHLMANLFEVHDRSRFELIAFSFGPQKYDEMRYRAESSFDKFIDASAMSDKAVALVSRYLEIDVAVDLKGYTTHSRPNIFNYRTAPVQVNYLGFPGTMGAKFIDYIVADRIIIPDGNEKYYSEKVLRVPNCYQVNDQKRPSPIMKFKRSELGLPEDSFVFCSFNNNYKILPNMLGNWAKILRSVPNSVFWILADNKTAEVNLRNEFEKRGIDPSRIIFATRMPSGLHLARQSCADLFLDTYPCAAHTTASDAVFSGLPILAMAGESFASRVSASILYAVGLPDLVCSSHEEYIEKAITLGSRPTQCRELSKFLQQTVRFSPLFNTEKTARDLESLYINALNEKVNS